MQIFTESLEISVKYCIVHVIAQISEVNHKDDRLT